MKFRQWPKRDPNKNYFLVPNEVFHIGLNHPEISIYCYLLSIEDRETYQCWPSYKTIGKALGMCENTVSKYVRSLEEKGLIRTEPTMIRSKDGRPLNGNLLYTICPIQAAVESFYERQFRQLEEDAARQRVAERLAESARRSPQNALCAPLGKPAGLDTLSGVESGFGPLSGAFPELPSATMALSSGVDVKTLSSMLGHYSAGFTLDTYTHITNDMQRGAAEKIGGFMETATAKPEPEPPDPPEESRCKVIPFERVG